MHSDFWKKLNEQFDRIHLQDTEIKTKSGTIYINPNVKLILGWLIFMILVVIFLAVCKPFSKKDAGDGTGNQGNEQSSENLGQSDAEFLRNEYPEVNSFIENYMQALTNCDINLLGTMVVDSSQFNEEMLQKRKQFIVGYSNIDCYTKPGLSEGSYVVYAVMNTQIQGVNAQPLSLHQFYLIPSEYGGFLQDNTSSTDPDIEAYLDKVNKEPDVKDLMDRVNKNNDDAAQADETLKAFYDMMNGTAE